MAEWWKEASRCLQSIPWWVCLPATGAQMHSSAVGFIWNVASSAGSYVAVNYTAFVRSHKSEILQLPAFLTFSNASQVFFFTDLLRQCWFILSFAELGFFWRFCQKVQCSLYSTEWRLYVWSFTSQSDVEGKFHRCCKLPVFLHGNKCVYCCCILKPGDTFLYIYFATLLS